MRNFLLVRENFLLEIFWVQTYVKPNLVFKNVPFTGEKMFSHVRKFFTRNFFDPRIRQVKSGVEQFSLY